MNAPLFHKNWTAVFTWGCIIAVVVTCTNIVLAAEGPSKPIAERTLELLAALEKSDHFAAVPLLPGARSGRLDARKHIKDEVKQWKDDSLDDQGVYVVDGYGFGSEPNIEALKRALGKPDRETNEELKPLLKEFKERPFGIADKTGKVIPAADPETGKALSGRVLWYGPVGFGFVSSDFGGERLTVIIVARSKAASGAPSNAKSSAPPAQVADSPQRLKEWPKYGDEIIGTTEVKVTNPNDFSVKVGLRCDGKGRDFSVPARDSKSVYVLAGRYDIYFQYSSDPEGLYQGDSFTLKGNGVEIQIVKVVNGNYGIRKVK